jgi:hypothetical protein
MPDEEGKDRKLDNFPIYQARSHKATKPQRKNSGQLSAVSI